MSYILNRYNGIYCYIINHLKSNSRTKKQKSRAELKLGSGSNPLSAAAEENKKSDYNDPDSTVIVKKIAKAVIHKIKLLHS